MYIHLGRDYVLNDRDIIGIFLSLIHISEPTRR